MIDTVYEFPITETFILNVRQSKGRRVPYAEEEDVMILHNFGNYQPVVTSKKVVNSGTLV